MWRVTNEVNKPILARYTLLIVSLFELVIELSKRKNKLIEIETKDFLEKEFDKKANLHRRLLTINRSADDKFISLIKKIIQLDSKELEEQYDYYVSQNKEIDNLNYNIKQEKHPAELIKLFKDYLYDKFFGVSWIWDDLIGKKYTRGVFKTDFRDENKLYVCSYCDTDTISNIRNSWIEHFLPKGKFPFICCNPNNLIPSCTSCNVSGSGKGEDVTNPIVNQYKTQIGDEIEFEFNNGEIKIKANKNDEIENYLELLKLRNRYREKGVNDSVISVLKINYEIAQGAKKIKEFDENIFFDFIQKMGRNRGFYFVQKDLLKYIDEL